MGLLDLFKNRDEKLCKLRDYLVLAFSDQELSEKEEVVIGALLKKEKITRTEFDNVFMDPDMIRDKYPKSDKEKLRYLIQLVALMMCDGECTEEEIQFCRIVAMKMGLNPDLVTIAVATIARNSGNDELIVHAVISYMANKDKVY